MSFYQKSISWYNWIDKRKPYINYVFKFSSITQSWYRSVVAARSINNAHNNAHIVKPVVGWCLSCCMFSELKGCDVCNLMHVCDRCITFSECFLDNNMNQLTLRTVKVSNKEDISKYLNEIISMYSKLFPMSVKLLRRARRKVVQNKSRGEFIKEWYNALTMPIQLCALMIKIDGTYYYVFGVYECIMQNRNCRVNYPFQLVNCLDFYDKLLLDDVNFNRLNTLVEPLKSWYACNYLEYSRVISDAYEEELQPWHFKPANYSSNFSSVTREYSRVFDRSVMKEDNSLIRKWLDIGKLKRQEQRELLKKLEEDRLEERFYAMDYCNLLKQMYWNSVIERINWSRLKCNHYKDSPYKINISECDSNDCDFISSYHKDIVASVFSVLRSVLQWDTSSECYISESMQYFCTKALSFPSVLDVKMLTQFLRNIHAIWRDKDNSEYALLNRRLMSEHCRRKFEPPDVDHVSVDYVVMCIVRLVGSYLSQFNECPELPDSVRWRDDPTLLYESDTESELSEDDEDFHREMDRVDEIMGVNDPNIIRNLNLLLNRLA